MSEVGVIGVGLSCPLGLYTRPGIAAIRAGLSAVEVVDEVLDRGGEAARANRLGHLDPTGSRIQRAGFFARYAIAEAMASLAEQRAALPVYLVLPEPGAEPGFDPAAFERELGGGRLSQVLELRHERLYRGGRAGMFMALEAASAAIVQGAVRWALVGGADSLVDSASLVRLAREDRLLGAHNPDGLLPGEGAAFVLLAAIDAVEPRQLYARLGASRHTLEPMPWSPGGRVRATGLSAVFRGLGSRVAGRVDRVFSAQNSEGAWARQFNHAYLRNAGLMPEPVDLELLGASLGELGAAAGGASMIQAIMCFHALVSGDVDPRIAKALVYGCADTGPVGGCLLRAP